MSTNLILIDSNLKDTDVLLSALNAQTTGILYKYDTSRNTILHQIDVAFSVKTIERVAICCHGGESRFLENGNFFDLDGSTNEVIKNENTQFVLHLLRTYNVSNIDFLACKSLKYNSWRKFYDLIESEIKGVTVGASEDDTGNVKYGGNWVMENTGEMIDDVYFNDDVKHYHYLMSNLIENVSKIKVTNTTYIHFTELIAYDEFGQNITQNKESTTSSNYGGTLPQYGNDGNLIAKDSTDPYILHTLNINPWFQIDLSGIYSISKIEIYLFYQFPDSLKSRYNDLKIILLDSYNNIITSFDFPLYDSDEFNNKLKINGNIHNLTIFSVPLSLSSFFIIPTDITFVNSPATINMTFSNNEITETDISNSLYVEPVNAGRITNIQNTLDNNWTADFIPIFGLILTDCSLNFKYETIDRTINFNLDTTFEILDFSLTPSNLVDTDVSATLRIEFNKPITGSSPNFNFTLDPSYIATLETMTDVSNGFVWEGVLTRTPNMNKLGNKLDFDFSYNGVEVSANLVFDVVENSQLVNKNWSLSNSATINNVFTKTLQMSPNGLLMGFINGANVEIYRKSENWIPDISFVGHQFALTNNYIAIASDASMQIYDYSGTSWSIMNGGNIAYLNIIALSINVDGNVVAVSNNNDVKVLQNESNNWTHINTYNDASVNGLSLSPNGQKLGLGIGTVGEDFSSILVKDVVNNHPPVITLVGDDIINHEINTAYTDFGATAVDSIDGDITGNILTINNVDTSVLGTYTITYDVSNSNNISAIQKRRTVNIQAPPYTLQYDNPTQDIFQLLNFYSNIKSQPRDTITDFSLTGNTGENAWKNGNYQVRTTSYRGDWAPAWYDSLFSNETYGQSGNVFEFRYNSNDWIDAALGSIYGTSSQWQLSGSGSSYDFVPYTVSSGSVDFTTPNGGEDGEYIHIEFPFLLKMSKFSIRNDLGYIPNSFQIMGSVDNITWEEIGRLHPNGAMGTFDLNVSLGNYGYKYFRIIVYNTGSHLRTIMENIYIYGIVYK